jgi:hypothetical protein
MGSDEDSILSILSTLDIRPLVQESWVVGAMRQVGAGALPKTKVEELFLKLGLQYLNELAYTEELQEENAHLQSMQFVD